MKYAILCGTVYGANYIPLLTRDNASIRLGGILSRGSARSLSLARNAGVPHHTSLDELSQNQADIVIVAVSGEAGIQLAKNAILKGFDVLAEHPWEPEHIKELCDLAESEGRVFHINSHWGDLHHALHFIEACQVASANGPPVFASMMSNPRTLYAGLDILRRAIGPLSAESLELLKSEKQNDDTNYPFVVIRGMMGQTQVTMHYQTFTSQIDDGTSALVNHHLVVGFPHGHVTLPDASTPAVWVPDMTSMCMMGEPGMKMPASNLYPDESAPTVAEFLQTHREEANLLALKRLVQQSVDGQIPSEQSRQHLVEVSDTWRQCLNLAGPITFIPSR